MRLFIFTAVFALVACTTGPRRINGPYADRLSHADIKQIQSLVAKDRNLDRRIVELNALRPDRVRVMVGGENDYGEGTSYSSFTVIRRAGKWTSDPFALHEIDATIVAH